jgi:lysophospholipase L1-like esterase
MAKPAAGATLDTGNALYTSLAHVWALLEGTGTSTADSRGTDTGTLSSAGLWGTSGGDPVVHLTASTAAPVALASEVTADGNSAWTIAFRAVQAGADNNGMILGKPATNQYIWLHGGDTLDYNFGSAKTFTGAAGDTTTLADWALSYTPSGSNDTTGTLRVYRNGTQVGTDQAIIGTFALTTLGNGYTGSLGLVGDLHYVYTWSGRALTSSEASTLRTNPYALFGSAALAAGTASTVSVGNTVATVTVGNATGGTAPYTYQWYRSTTSGFTPGGGNILSGATSQTLNDTGLTNGVTYYYKDVVTDSASTPATATSNQTSATPANITTYDLTDTTIAGVSIQVEGGAMLGTFGGSTAWGQSSSNWTDGGLHFKLSTSGSPATIEVETWNNGAVIRTAKNLTDVDHGTATTGSNAYGWVTVATGLDASAGPDIVLSWGMTMFVRKVRVTNAAINTSYLSARKVLAGYGDSITLGQAGTGGDSTLSWLHLAGLALNYQVLNRGIGSTAVVGSGTAGEARTADVTGGAGLPTPDVLVVLYGTNDAGAGTAQGTFGASELHMLRQLQTGLPSTAIVVERLLKTGVGDTTRDAYSTTIAAQVSALNCPKVTYAQGMYGAYDGSDGVHPVPGAHMTALAAAVVADVPAGGGGAAAFAPIGCGFIKGI